MTANTPPAGDPFEAGVRQAIEWLRADYEYGTGPDWREHGAEWIAERLADHRRERFAMDADLTIYWPTVNPEREESEAPSPCEAVKR